MNFDEAVAAHSAWKRRLSAYIAKRDDSLNADEVSQDRKCSLGRWIYGEGVRYCGMPAFAALKKEHALFHCAAANVIRKADSGQSVPEELAVGSGSEFMSASSKVVLAIMEMKKQAGS